MDKLQKINFENDIRSLAQKLVKDARETDGFGEWWHDGESLSDELVRKALSVVEDLNPTKERHG